MIARHPLSSSLFAALATHSMLSCWVSCALTARFPPRASRPRLVAGEVAALVVPLTRSITPSVRAAATMCLGSILLQPGVQAALAATPGGKDRGACPVPGCEST